MCPNVSESISCHVTYVTEPDTSNIQHGGGMGGIYPSTAIRRGLIIIEWVFMIFQIYREGSTNDLVSLL